MKPLFFYFLFVCSILSSTATQGANGKPERTPVQEAEKQTVMLCRELDLTPEQADLIYTINLKYAQNRSKKPADGAVELIENKNLEYQRVLTKEQYNKLQSKRHYTVNRALHDTSNKVQGDTLVQVSDSLSLPFKALLPHQ